MKSRSAYATCARPTARPAAVDGVSFEVQPGEVFGLLGPNGADKTTTVEILEGLRTQDSGEAVVLGIDVAKAARRAKGSRRGRTPDGGALSEAHAHRRSSTSSAASTAGEPAVRRRSCSR